MRTLKQIEIGRYTFLGVSNKGVLHVCYWDDEKEGLVWIPKDEVIDLKTNEVIRMRLLEAA